MATKQQEETREGEPSSPADAGPRPVRWGAVFAVALPLIVLNTGWIANSEMKTGVTELTISTLFLGVTFMLFVVTLLNLAARCRVRGARGAEPAGTDGALHAALHFQRRRRGRPLRLLPAVPGEPVLLPNARPTAGRRSGTCCPLTSARATRPSSKASSRGTRPLFRPAVLPAWALSAGGLERLLSGPALDDAVPVGDPAPALGRRGAPAVPGHRPAAGDDARRRAAVSPEDCSGAALPSPSCCTRSTPCTPSSRPCRRSPSTAPTTWSMTTG